MKLLTRGLKTCLGRDTSWPRHVLRPRVRSLCAMEEPVRGYRRKISVQAALPQLDEPGLTFVSPWLCPGGGRFEAAELDHICGVWDEEKEPTNAPRQWIRQPSQSGNDMRHHVEVHASHREQEWNHHHHHHAIGIQFLRSANKSLSHVHVHLLLLLLFAFSWPGASDPAPYSCHPYPHTPVTPILCTRIHASRVYEVHYGFRVVYLTYLNPTRYMRYTTGIRGIRVRKLGYFDCVLKFDSPLPEDHRVNILSTADSLRHHCKLGGGSASISGTNVYRRSKWGRRIFRRPRRAKSDCPTPGDRGAALTLVRLE